MNARRALGVIACQGRYLLVQEAKPHLQGVWSIPGGKAEPGETAEQAVLREVAEETGLQVRVERKMAIKLNRKQVFVCTVTGGGIEYDQAEITDARWFTLPEIMQMGDQLRGAFTLRIFAQLAEEVAEAAAPVL